MTLLPPQMKSFHSLSPMLVRTLDPIPFGEESALSHGPFRDNGRILRRVTARFVRQGCVLSLFVL
jgi:hypothetical protein